MNVTPNETFLALQAAQAEALSRQAEGEALCSADASPTLRPAWPIRFDLSGQ